jgi:hypothetical protein
LYLGEVVNRWLANLRKRQNERGRRQLLNRCRYRDVADSPAYVDVTEANMEGRLMRVVLSYGVEGT